MLFLVILDEYARQLFQHQNEESNTLKLTTVMTNLLATYLQPKLPTSEKGGATSNRSWQKDPDEKFQRGRGLVICRKFDIPMTGIAVTTCSE